MADDPSERPYATRTINDFARALGRHLPHRLTQLRRVGKQTRALGGRRPKRQS